VPLPQHRRGVPAFCSRRDPDRFMVGLAGGGHTAIDSLTSWVLTVRTGVIMAYLLAAGWPAWVWLQRCTRWTSAPGDLRWGCLDMPSAVRGHACKPVADAGWRRRASVRGAPSARSCEQIELWPIVGGRTHPSGSSSPATRQPSMHVRRVRRRPWSTAGPTDCRHNRHAAGTVLLVVLPSATSGT
jgi:hypothetical protein